MRAKTEEGERLMQLAKKYARAYHDWNMRGEKPKEEWEEINERLNNAKAKLRNAVDELTSIDLTPRAVSESNDGPDPFGDQCGGWDDDYNDYGD